MKQKTRKIVSKRFKLSKTGKVLRRTQGMRHIRRNKSASRKRSQDAAKQVTNTKYKRTITAMLRT